MVGLLLKNNVMDNKYGIGNRKIKTKLYVSNDGAVWECLDSDHQIDMQGDLWVYAGENGWLVNPFKHSRVVQYTGIKDSKGLEVCEGDILYLADSGAIVAPYRGRAIVDYSEVFTSFILGSEPWWETDGDIGSTDNIDSCRLEHWSDDEDKCYVLGNVFENPELL